MSQPLFGVPDGIEAEKIDATFKNAILTAWSASMREWRRFGSRYGAPLGHAHGAKRNQMKVSDVMTKRVVSISPETSIVVGADLMLKHHISGLPVIDNHAKLVGIVTEGDFVRRAEIGTENKGSSWINALRGTAGAAANYVHSHGLAIKDIMTRNPVTVTEDTNLDEAVRLMEIRNIKRLPVLRDGKLIGIISRANLMRALLSIHRKAPQASNDDAAIRERILADAAKQSWSSGATLDAVVHDGIVDLWGTLTEPSQRAAFVVLAKSVPGVALVQDHLTSITPTAGNTVR